jgi:hypothetical protein
MTKKLAALFARVLAVLFGLYGLIPIAVGFKLAEDPWWFRAMVGLGGLTAIACGVVGFWCAGNWYRRLSRPSPPHARMPESGDPA